MNVEERAELEQLRQQHQSPKSVPQSGNDDRALLHRLKSLPEDEAVALLLELRSGAQVQEVSSGPEPGRSWRLGPKEKLATRL